jgi:hypothetical protein
VEEDDGHAVKWLEPADVNDLRVRVSSSSSRKLQSRGPTFERIIVFIYGKRESIKFFGLALHKPGFEVRYSESRDSPAVHAESDNFRDVDNPYEVNCFMLTTRKAMLCAVQSKAMDYVKIFCLQCLTATAGFHENTFVQVRNPET